MNNSDLIVTGILQLLKNCPPELVSVRKDLLAISRHIISDFRLSMLKEAFYFFLKQNDESSKVTYEMFF